MTAASAVRRRAVIGYNDNNNDNNIGNPAEPMRDRHNMPGLMEKRRLEKIADDRRRIVGHFRSLFEGVVASFD